MSESPLGRIEKAIAVLQAQFRGSKWQTIVHEDIVLVHVLFEKQLDLTSYRLLLRNVGMFCELVPTNCEYTFGKGLFFAHRATFTAQV